MKILITEKQYILLIEQGDTESILIVGDSHSVDAGFTYSSLLKKSKENVKIIAVGGKNTRWMKEQLSTELSKNHYDKVVIWGGTNDAFSMISNSEVVSNIQQMVDMVNKQNGKAYVIVGFDQEKFSVPGKFKPTKYATSDKLDQMRSKFIEQQKMISNSINNAIIIPAFDVDNSYTSDNIHGNSSAHSIVYNKVLDYLNGKGEISQNKTLANQSGSDVLERLKKYENENLILEAESGKKTFKKEVEDVQIGLKFLGYELPSWGVDGKFGPETEKAVKSFQSKESLNENGIIDKEFLEKFISILESKDFSESDLGEDITNGSLNQNQSMVIKDPGVSVRQYPSDLIDKFKKIVGDNYDTFISDLKSIGLDPTIAIRQLYTESGFSPDVINCSRKSSAGAMGLAQFMPGTWQSYGGGGDPCNVKDALKAYVKLMKDLMAKFPGRIDLALAGYNGGPNRNSLKNALNNDTAFTELKGSIPDESYKYSAMILQA